MVDRDDWVLGTEYPVLKAGGGAKSRVPIESSSETRTLAGVEKRRSSRRSSKNRKNGASGDRSRRILITMSANAFTTRWPLVAGLIVAGMFPQTTASASGAPAAENQPASRSCCREAKARGCCAMSCCATPSPQPLKPLLPASSKDDRRGGSTCPLIFAPADATSDHDKAAANQSHDSSSLAGVSSTLQSTHVRLNA